MNDAQPSAHDVANLRGRAEVRVRTWEANTRQRLVDTDVGALLHELRVHQIELEMQNEALREAQLAAETVRNKYQELYDFAPVGYLTCEADGLIHDVNVAGATLLGVDPRFLVNRRIQLWVEEAARIRFTEFLRDIVSTDAKQVCELALLKSERWPVHVRLEGVATAASSGAPAVCRIALIDLTERKQAEEALRLSEARYRAAIEDQIELVCRFEVEGTVTFVNEAFCRALGMTRDAVIGRSLMGVMPGEDGERLRAHLGALDRENPVGRHEHRMVAADGRIQWLQWTDRALIDAQGQVVEFESVGRDVTELKRLEEQLHQGQRMEAVGRLAGGIAHDFNNLLTVIQGRCELLLGRLPDNTRANRDVELIGITANRAAALTSKLLAFSRKQVLQPTVLDPRELVGQMVPILQRLVGENVHLHIIQGLDAGRVKVDAVQLEQVIVNLVVNARDAMPVGGQLTFRIEDTELDEAFARSHPDARPGRYVMLEVSDTGIGMDPETKAHVFEPFFTTKEQGRGTGLGLAMVYGIVTQSGGHIRVESELGRGATFAIYLPRIDARAEAVTAGPVYTGATTGQETILLVEDEDTVRDVVREILEHQGYTVLEARHPGEGLLIGERYAGPVDLLLTDVVMPQMDGRELAARLMSNRQQLRVLCMSGYLETSPELGTRVAFIPKPFSPAALARKVREVLDAPEDGTPGDREGGTPEGSR